MSTQEKDTGKQKLEDILPSKDAQKEVEAEIEKLRQLQISQQEQDAQIHQNPDKQKDENTR
jgi:hypothetical protein